MTLSEIRTLEDPGYRTDEWRDEDWGFDEEDGE